MSFLHPVLPCQLTVLLSKSRAQHQLHYDTTFLVTSYCNRLPTNCSFSNAVFNATGLYAPFMRLARCIIMHEQCCLYCQSTAHTSKNRDSLHPLYYRSLTIYIDFVQVGIAAFCIACNVLPVSIVHRHAIFFWCCCDKAIVSLPKMLWYYTFNMPCTLLSGSAAFLHFLV